MYFVSFTLFIFFFTTCLSANESKNVLIINSYHKGFVWSDKIIEGIEKIFYEANINSNVLYMDSLNISSPTYFEKQTELYRVRFNQNHYDLIIVLDSFAYDFILDNYAYLKENQAIFFVGIEKFSQKKVNTLDVQKNISGIIEKRDISETVKIIPKLFPKIKKLYIINEKSKNGDETDSFIKESILEIKSKYKVEYIREMPFEEMKNKFSVYKEDEIILFIRYYKDPLGKKINNKEISAFMASAKLPIFITDTLFIGSGALGGKLINIDTLGIRTGQKVIEILNKEELTPYISVNTSYNYIFDYAKVKKFKIRPLDLHKPFSYVNSSLAFFENNRSFIDMVFIFSPFLFFLILALIHNLVLRIKNSKLLEQRILFGKVLLDAIKSPILWHNDDGLIVDLNSKFVELLEMRSSKLHKEKLKHYIHENDAKRLINLLVNTLPKDLNNKEITLINKEEKELKYLVNQTPYIDNIFNTSGSVTVLTDVTKEREALKEKSKQQEFIIQQSKLAEIGEIFSSIAHQWKSPLVEIATIAQEQFYSLSENMEEKDSQYVNDIMVQVKYMTNTVDDFQSFIMPSVKETTFNIKEAVEKMMNIINHNIKYNYIDLEIEVEKNANLIVLGYKNELMQTLLNVVNNAKQAIVIQRKNKNSKQDKIKISIKNIGKYILIEIEDNGGGIPEKYLKKVFDPYFTTKKDGHGIGLYMAKLIIEDKMNGKIYMENTKVGAKMSIKLLNFCA